MRRSLKKLDVILLMCKGTIPIIIPLIAYLKFGSIELGIVSCVIWRLSSLIAEYFTIRQNLCYIISIIAFGGCFVTNNKMLFILGLSIALFFFFSLRPFVIDKYKNNFNRIFYLLGMIISGLLLVFGNYIFFYLIFMSSLAYFLHKYSDSRITSCKLKVNRNLLTSKNKRHIFIEIGAFCHNAHYYSYSIIIPILLYLNGINLLAIGILFSLGWIYYLFKEKIIFKFNKYKNTSLMIIIGFISTAILLLTMGFDNILLMLSSWFLTGFTAGVSESFWYYKDVQITTTRFIWKIGGVIGAILAFITYIFTGSILTIFIVAITLCLAGAVSFSCVLFLERTTKE